MRSTIIDTRKVCPLVLVLVLVLVLLLLLLLGSRVVVV